MPDVEPPLNNAVFSNFRGRYGMSKDEYERRYSGYIKEASHPDYILLALDRHQRLVHMVERQGKRRKIREAALFPSIRTWLDDNTTGWEARPSPLCNWFVELRFTNDVDRVHFTLKWL